MGKTTLLRLLGKKLLPIPPLIDMLIVEQEIEGTNVSAIDAVLAADKKRTRLLETEATLLKQLDEMEDDVDPTKIIEDLKQVTSDLEQHGAANAESKARKDFVWFGLYDGDARKGNEEVQWRVAHARFACSCALY